MKILWKALNRYKRTPSLRSFTRSFTSRSRSAILVFILRNSVSLVLAPLRPTFLIYSTYHFVNVFCWTLIHFCCSAYAILSYVGALPCLPWRLVSSGGGGPLGYISLTRLCFFYSNRIARAGVSAPRRCAVCLFSAKGGIRNYDPRGLGLVLIDSCACRAVRESTVGSDAL